MLLVRCTKIAVWHQSQVKEEQGVEIHEFSSKMKLEQACLMEVGWWFTQAKIHFLETGLNSLAFQVVLKGTFTPPDGFTLTACKVLAALARLQNIENILTQTIEENCRAWQRAQELTSSSPSHVHFGHCIAATNDSVLDQINMWLTEIPLQTGYSPKWWWCSINIMLEKQVGNNCADKLQIIHLFKVDFNFTNKWLGQAIMAQAERQQLMANEQYGSHKGHLVIQCLNKRLWYDYIRGTWIPAALCSNDAKSCYNCIVPWLQPFFACAT